MNNNGNNPTNEADNDIDLDLVVGTGVGSDRTIPENIDSPNNDNDGGNIDNPPNHSDTGEELKDYLVNLNNDNLSTEDLATKKDILNKYKGTSFDTDGNILDANGEIVASLDEVQNYINSDNITLDEAGNQVDESGNIVKTKQELDLENSVVNNLHKNLEVEFLNDEGQPKVYSDDDAGFMELANDIAKYRLEEYKENFFNSNPELTEIAKHILSGGKVEDFQSSIDYLTIDSKKLSDTQKLDYIKKSLVASGMDEERADKYVSLTKAANEIDKELPVALKALNKIEEQKKAERDAQFQAKVEEDNKRMREYWTNVHTVINGGKIGNINIADNERQAFFDYVSKPVNNSQQSQEMLDSANEDIDTKLLISYMRYKKFNFGTLVQQLAKQEKVQSLRERLNKFKNSNASIKGDNYGQETYKGDITIDML